MQTRDTQELYRGFKWLPWAAIVLVLVFYFLTLERWLSTQNLAAIAELDGWDWKPLSSPPLHSIIIYPLKFLPVSIQPTALSALSVVCAGLSLALLARTVMILPQERTRLQRQRVLDSGGVLPSKLAWLPACLAVFVCGLQLTFWQSATTFSTDILDLVIMAYVVRGLAEFRKDRQESWLFKAALAYGFGISSNFAMIAYFPIFLVTAAWIQGRSFFSFQFLWKFGLLGCVGLLCYLAIPISHSTSGISDVGFWGSLRDYLGFQKHAVLDYRRVTALFLGCVSLLPLIGMAFRWGESNGDISGTGARVTTLMTQLLHGAFLLLGIAVAFEYHTSGGSGSSSEISIQSLARAAGTPVVLGVHFLSALSVGYYAGYFLLICGTPSVHKWARPSALEKGLQQVAVVVLGILLVAVPGALLYRHLGNQWKSHSPALNRLAYRLQEGLPDASFSISDSPLWFYLTQAGASMAGRSQKVVHIESLSLMLPGYHKLMKAKTGPRWPSLPREYPLTSTVDPGAINVFLTSLSLSNRVYYTEPSFGFFFEAHFLEAEGMVNRLLPMPVKQFEMNPLSPEQANRLETYWKTIASDELERLRRNTSKKPLKPVIDPDNGVEVSRSGYSRALNFCAVQLQRSGYKDKAATLFQWAVDLNPSNPTATINAAFNQQVRTNGSIYVTPTQEMTDLIRAYGGNWDVMLRANGPFDETGNMILQARTFAEHGNPVQAAQMLHYAAVRSPEPYEFNLGVAKMLTQAGRPDLALTIADSVRKTAPQGFLNNVTNQLELVEVEARCVYGTGDLAKAEALLTNAIKQYPSADVPYATLVSIYLQRASLAARHSDTNEFRSRVLQARKTLEQQLATQPNAVSAWVGIAATHMHLDEPKAAIEPLTRALSIDKDNTAALINRAICYFRNNQLTEAQQDYEHVRNILPETPFPVWYGLAEIAAANHRNKEAIEYYEQYLKKAPPSSEADKVRAKLKSLK